MERFFFLCTCLPIIIFGCIPHTEKELLAKGKIGFEAVTIQSEIINCNAQLEGNSKLQELSLHIELRNHSTDEVNIEDINIETAEGYQANLIDQDFKTFSVTAGTKSSMVLRFKPVNDYGLYMVTGDQGKLRPLYHLTIAYKNDGNKTPSFLKSQFKVVEEDYIGYERDYSPKVIGYKLSAKNNSSEEQINYLQAVLKLKSSVFAHFSDQEIAVAGLNFRLQSYQKNDSLYARFFMVNHADFPIKINPEAFDIFDNNFGPEKIRKIGFRKISGLKDEANILRKGDRAILDLSKYSKGIEKDKLKLILRNVFLLDNDIPLFYSDMVLIKI